MRASNTKNRELLIRSLSVIGSSFFFIAALLGFLSLIQQR